MAVDEEARLLRYLGHGAAGLAAAADPARALVTGEGRPPIAVSRETIARLKRARRLVLAGGRLSLPPRPAAPRAVATRRVAEGDRVAVHLAESPLAVLARLRGRDGAPFLAADEVAAGERLRVDFTLGGLTPRISARLDVAVATGRRGGGAAELTDTALAARQRLHHALDAVGPELSGLLIDVCGFLKGLELVEAERQLPARSAKVLVKTGLAMLARHYAPGQRGLRRWGAADYRPACGAG